MTKNNFDLVRLFAASQVLLFHALLYLGPVGYEFGWPSKAWDFIPGVPIFFFVSGYLISEAYDRSGNIYGFFRNRGLRIFPGLWLCFVVSVLSVSLTGFFWIADFSVADFAIWAFAQLSIGQAYNPDFMRNYGVGNLNGSLWTIGVEIQLYLLMPVLAVTFRKFRKV